MIKKWYIVYLLNVTEFFFKWEASFLPPWVILYMLNKPHDKKSQTQSLCLRVHVWFGCQHILLLVSSNLAIYRNSLLFYKRNKWLLEEWAEKKRSCSCPSVVLRLLPRYMWLQLLASAGQNKQRARLLLRTGLNTVYIAPVWRKNAHNPRTQVLILATW